MTEATAIATTTRPCEVTSHQFHCRGWFHCFAVLNGKIHAFVEGECGKVGTFDMSYHSITFLDPKPVPRNPA
jgi:hypothetical protein